jgi:hypothetical protein
MVNILTERILEKGRVPPRAATPAALLQSLASDACAQHHQTARE